MMKGLGLRPVLAARRRRLDAAARPGPAGGDRPPARVTRRSRGPAAASRPRCASTSGAGRRRAHGGPLAQRRGRRGVGGRGRAHARQRGAARHRRGGRRPTPSAPRGSRATRTARRGGRRRGGPPPAAEGDPYTRPAVETFELVRAILIVVAAYVIGGIPWSIIVARLTGRTDPRTIGSGRTGRRERDAGHGPAARARCRGSSTCSRAPRRSCSRAALGAGTGVEVVAGLAAIIGHSRSPFLGLGGGRGVAPAFGGLLAFSPADRRDHHPAVPRA